MYIFRKNKKKIPDGKYRIIKIGKEALTEFIYDSINENAKRLFDVNDETSIVKCYDIDWEKGELLLIARNEYGENEHLQFDFDTEEIFKKIKNTATTLSTDDKCYIELTEEEIKTAR